MDVRKCSNKDGDGCVFPATVRYTWPGRDEAFACLPHALQLLIGLHLQMIRLTPEEMMTEDSVRP
jgi:hypothetical protein